MHSSVQTGKGQLQRVSFVRHSVFPEALSDKLQPPICDIAEDTPSLRRVNASAAEMPKTFKDSTIGGAYTTVENVAGDGADASGFSPRSRAAFELRQRQVSSGLANHGMENSTLEAEAAEHAVNYHRVRRRVQEDIRRTLLQNPFVRNSLQGTRTLRRDTIEFLARPAHAELPLGSFAGSGAIDWIAIKAEEAARRRAAQEARDRDLAAFKEEQQRELAQFRRARDAAAQQLRREHEREAARAEVASSLASRKIASEAPRRVNEYAEAYQARCRRARERRGHGFAPHAVPQPKLGV